MAKDYFTNAVNSVSVSAHISSKKDFIEYYRDTYGEKKWKSQAAMDLSGTTDKKSLAYKSARRNFEGKRLTEAGDTKKWKEEGRKLPPIRTLTNGKNSITITVKGDQKGNHGRKDRKRTINVTLKGEKAQKFIDNPSWSDIWDEYGFDFGIDDDEGDIDPDYSLENVSVSAS